MILAWEVLLFLKGSGSCRFQRHLHTSIPSCTSEGNTISTSCQREPFYMIKGNISQLERTSSNRDDIKYYTRLRGEVNDDNSVVVLLTLSHATCYFLPVSNVDYESRKITLHISSESMITYIRTKERVFLFLSRMKKKKKI